MHLNNGHFDVLLVGWSRDQARPAAFYTKGHNADGHPAFEMRKVRKFISPNDGATTLTEIYETNAGEIGLRLLEQQRSTKYSPLGTDRSFHAVGGYAQHTIIRANEITTRVLKRWSDEVGKPIECRAGMVVGEPNGEADHGARG